MPIKPLSECCNDIGGTVDATESVVRGVKVLGYESANGRTYLREAMAKALPMYEGCKINLDHPDDTGRMTPAQRRFSDRFGRLKGVRLESDGYRGDLHYNPAHPLAEAFRWWVQNDPSAVGLSHNCTGRVRDENGREVVEEIISVESVDLVADPASTKGLFESKSTKLNEEEKDMVEDGDLLDDLDLDAPGDEPEPDADDMGGEDDGDGDWKQHLVDAVSKLVKSDDPKDHEMAKKILAMMKPGKPDDGMGDDMPADDEGGDEAETMESLRAKLDAYQLKEKRAKAIKDSRCLCQKHGLVREAITTTFVESLVAAPSDKARVRLIEDRKRILTAGRSARPISSNAGENSVTLDSFVQSVLEGEE